MPRGSNPGPWRSSRRGPPRCAVALDRPERAPRLVGTQPPTRVLGQQALDDRTEGPTRSNGAGGSVTTAVRVATGQPLPKGDRPSTAAYSVAPSEKKSDAGPRSAPWTRSGDTYAGLPTIVHVEPPGRSSVAEAMPKSVRTTRGPSHSCRLLGFTSRWTMPARWVACSASSRRSPMLVAWSTGSGPSSRRAASSVRPGSASMTIQGWPASSTRSYTCTVPGWLTRAASRASRSRRARAVLRSSPVSRPVRRTCLIATGRCNVSSWASQTAPMPPWPSSRRSR